MQQYQQQQQEVTGEQLMQPSPYATQPHGIPVATPRATQPQPGQPAESWQGTV